MSNTKQPSDNHSKASATELDESDLENVEGGAEFLKLDSIGGDSLKSRLTKQEVAGLRDNGTKLRDLGSKVRPGVKKRI